LLRRGWHEIGERKAVTNSIQNFSPSVTANSAALLFNSVGCLSFDLYKKTFVAQELGSMSSVNSADNSRGPSLRDC